MRFNRYSEFPNRFLVFRLAFNPGSVFPARGGEGEGKKKLKFTPTYFHFSPLCIRHARARDNCARCAKLHCVVEARAHILLSACGFFTTAARTLPSPWFIFLIYSPRIPWSVSLIRVHRARFTGEVEWKAALLVLVHANLENLFFQKSPLYVAKSVLG